MAKVYLASSWSNKDYPSVLKFLRNSGHEVYDFRDPEYAFSWDWLDPNWERWTLQDYLKALETEEAKKGYESDLQGLEWADFCVLLLPCGRSAHLELGYAKGKGKQTAVFVPPYTSLENLAEPPFKPELMYKMVDLVTDNLVVLDCWLLDVY